MKNKSQKQYNVGLNATDVAYQQIMKNALLWDNCVENVISQITSQQGHTKQITQRSYRREKMQTQTVLQPPQPDKVNVLMHSKMTSQMSSLLEHCTVTNTYNKSGRYALESTGNQLSLKSTPVQMRMLSYTSSIGNWGKIKHL